MPGYSGKPAYKKLGLKPNMRVKIINSPSDYLDLIRVEEPDNFEVMPASANLDFIHFFTKEKVELERELPRLKEMIQNAGMIWVSWPKKAAKVPTDVSGDVVRAAALAIGLVDIKVCAVDDVWSGLKMVIPVKDR